MNNKEIIEIKKLREEKKQIEKIYIEINSFIKRYKSSFHYRESLEAIERIVKYIKKLEHRTLELDELIEEYEKVLSTNCHHRIMISPPDGFFGYECPICKTRKSGFGDSSFPDTVEFIIDDMYYEEEIDIIDNIVMNGENIDLVEKELIDHFTELQFSKDVKIRRRIK